MRVTKALTAAVATTYNISAEMATNFLSSAGVCRSAECLDMLDFANYRMEKVSTVADSKLEYITLVNQGKLPRGTRPALTLNLADLAYTPLVGEHVIAWYEKDKEFYSGLVQDTKRGFVSVGAVYEDEKWEDQFKNENVWVPIHHLTTAGTVTISTFNHFFSTFLVTDVAGMQHPVTKKVLDTMATSLAASGVTFTDLFNYLLADTEDVESTKFFKRHVKKYNSFNSCTFTQLVTGELVAADVIEPEAKPATESKPKLTGFDASKAAFDRYVDELKGSSLKNFYTTVCKMAHVKEDDKETVSKSVKAHIQALANSESKINKLMSAVQ